MRKIENLEMERNELREQLNRLLKRTNADKNTVTSHTTRIHTIEENLQDAEEGL